MNNDNLISALRNMVDDIENLGAAPFTVDVNVLRQAIAALTPHEGYVLVQAMDAKALCAYVTHSPRSALAARRVEALLAARPEVSP